MVEAPRTTPLGKTPYTASGLMASIATPAATPPFLPIVPPGIHTSVSAAGALFPFQFTGQPQTSPGAICLSVFPAYTDDGMVSFLQRKLTTCPHRMAIIGSIWGAVTRCLDKALVLGI